MAERIEHTPEIEHGNELLNRVKQIEIFQRQPNNLVPHEEISSLVKDINDFHSSLPDINDPQNLGELFNVEIKRRLAAEVASLSVDISSEVASWQDVIRYHGIPQKDLDNLETWLAENMDKVSKANQRNFTRTKGSEDRAYIPLGSTVLRTQAESLITQYILRTTTVLRDFLPAQLGVKEALKKYQVIVDSWQNRSYCNWISGVVGICTTDVAFMNQGEIYVDEPSFLALVGHELIGHACHNTLTHNSDLPTFFRTITDTSIHSTGESISQYFEEKILDYLRKVPGITEKLGLTEPFENIYQKYHDDRLIQKYKSRRYQFAILSLAKAGKANFRDQIPAISKYSLEPQWVTNFIENLKYGWDEITGRLLPKYVRELMYAADPVGRIMENTPIENIPEAERLVLTGFWMPQGLEQWVQLNLSNHLSK